MHDEGDDDTWPIPDYNPGERLHLHALGVIAITFAAFERSIDDLFRSHPKNNNNDQIFSNYVGLNIKKRIAAVRRLFKDHENDKTVIAAVENVLDYFNRCSLNRNELLHAEQYPALFGGEPETLYLIKRARRSLESVYLKLKLPELRAIADYIRAGVVQCAEIHIYLRFRGRPEAEITDNLRVYVRRGPPSPKEIPPPLNLTVMPET